MGKLDGKVALVTGGNSGIGLATAKRFVEEGAHVYITGRREAELAAAVKELGKSATGVQGDVTNLADLDRLVAQIKSETRSCRAAQTWQTPHSSARRASSISEEHYNLIFDANVKGVIFTVQKALPLVPDGGSIILNASIVATKGFADWSMYSAAKAAVRSFARTWTSDLKQRRIRVNAVSPGFTDTPAWHVNEAAEQRIPAISKTIPHERFGTADEVAKAVLFLASDDSSYVTGAELFVDGGFAQV
jgi:NAD(P)-dependent dehydrogenase (short-subunit alcohol dehydrogenase family)